MEIIVNLSDIGIDVEDIISNGATEEVRKSIFDALKEEYLDRAADKEAYLYEDYAEERFLFGTVDSAALIARSNAWNQEIKEEFLRRLKVIYKADAYGILPKAENLPMDTSETYALRKAAQELDNLWFDYADHAVYMANSQGFPYFRVILSDDELKAIRERPQDYAIVEVYPK